MIRRVLLTLALVPAMLGLLLTPSMAFAETASSPRFTDVDTGDRFAMALTDDGSVYTWGYNDSGQLGTGAEMNFDLVATPQLVAFPGLGTGRIIDVAAGSDFGVALSDTGRVWTWGNNSAFQLGRDTVGSESDTPSELDLTGVLHGDERVMDVAAGSGHGLALTDAGRVYGWGFNESGQANFDTYDDPIASPEEFGAIKEELDDYDATPYAIAAHGSTSLVLTDDQWGIAWGYNGNGRLGIGSASNNEDAGYLLFDGAPDDATVVSIDLGDYHGIAALSDGSVWTWGDNEYGQLGLDPSTSEKHEPTQVTALSDEHVVAVAASSETSYAVTDDGRLFAWGSNGWNGEGTLGIGSDEDIWISTPSEVTLWPAVRGVAAIVNVGGGGLIGGAVTETGGLYMWGESWGRGDGADDTEPTLSPANIHLGTLSVGSVALSTAPQVGAVVTATNEDWPDSAELRTAWYLDGSLVGDSSTLTPDDSQLGKELVACTTAVAENYAASKQVCSEASEVRLPPPPMLKADSFEAEAGAPLAQTLPFNAVGSTVFSVVAGTLPDGISLDPTTGELQGSSKVAGSYSFTVELRTASGTDEREYHLQVRPSRAIIEVELQLSAARVNQGGSLTYTVTGEDVFGNDVSNLVGSSLLSVTSDVPSDVIAGNTITFPHASPHTITASYGGQASSTAVVEVIPTSGRPADTSELPTAGGRSNVAIQVAGIGLLIAAATAWSLRTRRRR